MKKVLAVILTLMMLTMLFVGCGEKKEEVVDTKAPADTTVKAEDPTAAPETTELEPVTLKWYLHGSNVTDDSEVLAKANEYLKEKINVTLEPIWGTWGDFDSNAVLAINGGDDVDIYFTCSWSADEYNAFARKGAWVRLDNPDNNLIEQYAPDLWKTLPSVLTQGATINGSDGYGVYAVPGYKDIATQNCWDINVPLLEKYGYTVEDIKNADYFSFGDILKKVKEGEGDDFYPLLVEGNVLERMVNNSIIVTGDSGTNNLLSYYINPTDTAAEGIYGNKLLSKFETPEYKKFVEKTREYFLAGYIDPAMGNANQANDTRSAKQLTGEYLIGTQSYALGYEVQASGERGFEVAMVPCTPAYVDTTSSQGAMMAISTASENPERAMMFLNLLNTDPYLFTLLDYGVEGVHYNIENGEAVFTDKRADYTPWTNGMGNVTQLPPQKGQGADFWDGFKAYYGSAKEIPILGWAFDGTSVETEMGALANVAAEYALALNTGTVDPAEKLPEYIQKLKDNGIDKFVAEANTQLETFLSAKSK
ncbi:MAG: extracellular solute-binding protein family 1 [Herbinix sp.]|jgi:putative aldouronate transport system substrate-binding protein|nr:extracellular solute-binding protein family 1 [Herbinix sp.]